MENVTYEIATDEGLPVVRPLSEEERRTAEETRINELHAAGDSMERKMVEGKQIFLEREDLLWLRVLVERSGVKLQAIEGKANLAEQAEQLVAAFGAERLKKILPEIMVEVINNPAGEVYKGGVEKPKDADEQIRSFVGDFLKKQIERGRFVFDPKSCVENWQENTVYRLEAVMSVMNKLLWLMQSEDVEEDGRRRNTVGILKHLRERVIRGAERAGETIDPGVNRSGEKIIRFLPPKSVGVILDHMTRL